MNSVNKIPGHLMASEAAEATGVFARATRVDHGETIAPLALAEKRAIYTVARGSSDAAANILAYVAMRRLGIPVTSLPPSVFSVWNGVKMTDSAGFILSQSGASRDLVMATRGMRDQGAATVAITNVEGSDVEAEAHVTLTMNAGPERAVPATKSVIGTIGVGMAMLAAIRPDYRDTVLAAGEAMERLTITPDTGLTETLAASKSVFVVGRGTGFGTAHEVALKLKETCAIHAEAYSASEVLHGPLQLATKELFVLLLDTGEPETQASLDKSEVRFGEIGARVHRIRPEVDDLGATCPGGAAAMLLAMLYPVIHATALALGQDPDAPRALSKVTQTR